MNVRWMLPLALLALGVAGCRFKSWESFESATTPNPPGEWKGDPYAAGGMADSSGGTKTDSTYSKGARPGVVGKLDPNFDQPAKGTGLRPGETPAQAKPGYGDSNAPVAQPGPSEVR